MNIDATHQFGSLRRALKICSFAFLAISIFQILPVLISVGRTGDIFRDMMGQSGLPHIFILANALRNNFLVLALALLVLLGGALTATIRSKGGLFLYVNLGLCLLIWTWSTYVILAAQELLRLPLEKLYQ